MAKNMQLILRADVENIGRLGDIIKVKPGFGRNYLLPKGLAMPATQANLKQFELERRKLEAAMDKLRAEARTLAEKLAADMLTIEVRVGEGDKLYGSVTTSTIGDALDAKGIEIDRKKIVLDEAIRALGIYELEVRLHPDVRGELKVAVVRHGQTAEDLVKAEQEAAAAEEVAVETPVEAEAPAEETGSTEEDAQSQEEAVQE